MNPLIYSNGVKIIDADLIDRVVRESIISPRLRASVCLHTDQSDLMQRMVMALQPGTYMQPHKHVNPGKRELFTIYQGRVTVVIFGEDGQIMNTYVLACDKIRTLELAAGLYHTLVPILGNTVVLEVKDGPWESVERDKTFAPWAPDEGSSDVLKYQKELIYNLDSLILKK